MSLDHAILGLLHVRPKTGYDLKKTFDRSLNHFWPAQQSQIYRTLARLAEQGFVSSEVIPQQGRPNRRLYSLTPAGRRELGGWLSADDRPGPWRSRFLVHVYLAGLQTDEEVLGLLNAELDWARSELTELEELAALPSGPYGVEHPRESFFWYLPLDYGLGSLRSHIAWLERAVERVQRGDYMQGKAAAVGDSGSPRLPGAECVHAERGRTTRRKRGAPS